MIKAVACARLEGDVGGGRRRLVEGAPDAREVAPGAPVPVAAPRYVVPHLLHHIRNVGGHLVEGSACVQQGGGGARPGRTWRRGAPLVSIIAVGAKEIAPLLEFSLFLILILILVLFEAFTLRPLC